MKVIASAFLLALISSVNAAASAKTLVQIDYAGDEGCDAPSGTDFQNIKSFNKCVKLAKGSNAGAQVSNEVKQNILLKLYTDNTCKNNNSNISLPIGADICASFIFMEGSVIAVPA